MSVILGFLQSTWIIFLIIGIIMGAGIAGYYVDKNTDILNIEKKKKELKARSMDVEVLKSQIKSKNVSLGGAMGISPLGGGDAGSDAPIANDTVSDNVNANVAANVTANVTDNGEDLNVPLNLDLH